MFRVRVISSHQQIGWLSTLSFSTQVAIDMLLLPSHAGLLLICYSHAMAVVDRARFSIPCVSWLDSPGCHHDDYCHSDGGDNYDDSGDNYDCSDDDDIKHLTCEIHAQASASTELSGLSQYRALCAIIIIITIITMIENKICSYNSS